jgi:hypothetical protein
MARLGELRRDLERQSRGGAERAHRQMLAREIALFFDHRFIEAGRPGEPPPPPPGQPIGGGAGPAWALPDAGDAGGAGAAGGGTGAWSGYGRGVPPTLAGCSWDG